MSDKSESPEISVTESPKLSPKESPKESPKVSPKESPKGSPKKSPKESPKQLQNDISENTQLEETQSKLPNEEISLKMAESEKVTESEIAQKVTESNVYINGNAADSNSDIVEPKSDTQQLNGVNMSQENLVESDKTYMSTEDEMDGMMRRLTSHSQTNGDLTDNDAKQFVEAKQKITPPKAVPEKEPMITHIIESPVEEPDSIEVVERADTPAVTAPVCQQVINVSELFPELHSRTFRFSYILFSWKKCMGVESCVYPVDLSPVQNVCYFYTKWCLYLVAFIYLAILGSGAVFQWYRCKNVYHNRINDVHLPFNHSVGMEYTQYVCKHSLIWYYLFPQIVTVILYATLAVNWLYGQHHDLVNHIYKFSDIIVGNKTYHMLISKFLDRLESDRKFVTFTVFVVFLAAVVETVLVSGIIDPKNAFSVSDNCWYVVFGILTSFFSRSILMFCIVYVFYTNYMCLRYCALVIERIHLHLTCMTAQDGHYDCAAYVCETHTALSHIIESSHTPVSVAFLSAFVLLTRNLGTLIADTELSATFHPSMGLLPSCVIYIVVIYGFLYQMHNLTKQLRSCYVQSSSPNYREMWMSNVASTSRANETKISICLPTLPLRFFGFRVMQTFCFVLPLMLIATSYAYSYMVVSKY